jgi:hypothetical protein
MCVVMEKGLVEGVWIGDWGMVWEGRDGEGWRGGMEGDVKIGMGVLKQQDDICKKDRHA